MLKTKTRQYELILQQNSKRAVDATTACLRQHLATGTQKRASSAEEAFVAARALRDIVPDEACPTWLNSLLEKLDFVRKHPDNSDSVDAVQFIATNILPVMKNHQWFLDEDESNAGIDFETIFQESRADARIPELFDQLIAQLKELIASDRIDSRRVLRELESIIASLERAKTGSYLATAGGWNFLRSYMKNAGWEYLGSIPLLGPAIKALRTTMQEADKAVEQMQAAFQAKVEERIATGFPRLEYQPAPFPALPALSGEEGEDQAPAPAKPAE